MNEHDKALPFDLELSDVVIPERCPVFGSPLAARGGLQDNSPLSGQDHPSKGLRQR